VIGLLVATGPARAERTLTWERIDVQMTLHRDTSIDVVETMRVRVTDAWNGLYRELSLARCDGIERELRTLLRETPGAVAAEIGAILPWAVALGTAERTIGLLASGAAGGETVSVPWYATRTGAPRSASGGVSAIDVGSVARGLAAMTSSIRSAMAPAPATSGRSGSSGGSSGGGGGGGGGGGRAGGW
jgi:hypothetical protein